MVDFNELGSCHEGADLYSMIAMQARRYGDSPAILSPGKKHLGYAGMALHLAAIGRQFRALGLMRTDRVAIVVKERPQACLAYLSAAAHCIAVPLDPNATAAELTKTLRRIKARAVIGSPSLPALEEASKAANITLLRLTPDPETAALFSLPACDGQAAASDAENPSADAIAAILMSSGTTSEPKAIPLSHRIVLARGRRVATHLQLTQGDVCLSFRPTHLTSTLSVSLASVLVSGSAVVLPDGFDVDRFFTDLVDFDVTWFNAGPAHSSAILDRAPMHDDALTKSRLRFVRSSSTSLDPAMQSRIEALFGVPCIQSYSSTETGPIACNPLPPAIRRPGTVGVAMGSEIRICAADGTELPPGSEGEIRLRGPLVFAGYDEDPARTQAAFSDGWYKTGDLGRLDDLGYLTLCGRLNDVINRGGQKVSPVEVETVLTQHPAVADAVCFPQKHPTLGSVPAAAVVVRAGFPFDPAEILHFLRDRLSSYKLPVRIVQCDVVPRGPVGKILRNDASVAFAALNDTVISQPAIVPTAEVALSRHLAMLWAGVLGQADVDLDTDFFTLGGDSLRAVNLLLDVEELTGVHLDLEDMAGLASSVNAMAALIRKRRAMTPTANVREPSASEFADVLRKLAETMSGWGRVNVGRAVPATVLNPKGPLPPLFWCFNAPHEAPALAQEFGPDQPLVILRSLNSIVTDGAARRAMEPGLGRLYATEIARLQPAGGLRLGGNCQGARIMEDTARALVEMGRKVDVLAVLEHEPVHPCTYPLAMFFGAESTRHNPFLLRHRPEQDWARLHGEVAWDIIPGSHGQFFRDPFVKSFGARLKARLQAINASAT